MAYCTNCGSEGVINTPCYNCNEGAFFDNNFDAEIRRVEVLHGMGDIYNDESQQLSDTPDTINKKTSDVPMQSIVETAASVTYEVSQGQKDEKKDIITRKIALGRVLKDPWNLRTLSAEFRNDKEIVLAAVSQSSMSPTADVLEYASESLRNDKEVVLAAVKAKSFSVSKALSFASQILRDDKEVVLAAVSNQGSSIQYASKRLQSSREVVLSAVQSPEGGWALEYFDPIFQDDIRIVRIAVNLNGKALQYASPRLRGNREIVLPAVKQNGNAIMYASPSFDDDKEVVLAALNSPPYEDHADCYACNHDINEQIHGCMSRRLREDPSVNSAAVTNNGGLISNIFHWKELNEEKEKAEVLWQQKYGAIQKDRLERWRSDVEQWQQRLKDHLYAGYQDWRIKLEQMHKYKSWRHDVFTKFGKRCEICGKTENLETHHRKSLHSIWRQEDIKDIYQAFECDRLWDINNGSVLCHECHKRMESSKQHKNLSMN